MHRADVSFANFLIGRSYYGGGPGDHALHVPIRSLEDRRRIVEVRPRRQAGWNARLDLRASEKPNKLDSFLTVDRISGNCQTRAAQRSSRHSRHAGIASL